MNYKQQRLPPKCHWYSPGVLFYTLLDTMATYKTETYDKNKL